MRPEDRRGWLAFAFILWFGLGVAFDKMALVILAAGIVVADLISAFWRGYLRGMERRDRTNPDPLDNGGAVLDP